MNTARILRLQPLRQAATAFKQPVRQPLLRLQARPFHQTRTVLRSKEEDHSAHTITQRLRNLKRIPPELLPLGVVIAFAVFAAAFALARKLFTDKTLRLTPQRGGNH
ncbi:uncharacterized protein HMPREF1541_02356 [Cyphellophora europaea CBS 101466]|uniref:Uncharacterized protein n=1 Tax=Cyphellophora europaea (strain CBS 101466) TaxID=1220924 RepID=W2S3D1_CYPE1|nr:uncharacterized protein HMPREF1541_02356 [Cyphellophora europaea CBS 101466]ETN43197.1 hypothetical protein HMPREF1541_02356 [Cyphellophora europaea CBS 101466]